MIRDGIFYGLGFVAGAIVVGTVFSWPWSLPLFAFAAFLMYFFRDPERTVPEDGALVVSPADGKVTTVEAMPEGSEFSSRISIFLSIFDVHVNRSPIAGRISQVQYRRGSFVNAMKTASSAANEQNIVRVEGDSGPIVFSQIAGVLARRIVFWPSTGDWVERGQRIGLIKFGSRVDVFLKEGAEVLVRRGQHVRGGSSALARIPISAHTNIPQREANVRSV